MREERLLTETELEMMSILWNVNEGTVHDVLEGLPKNRNLAYTSVSTILRILEKKGFLKSRKDGKAHIYKPSLKRADYEARTVRHVVQNVFQGEKIGLVRQLIGSSDLSLEEIEELKRLLNEKGSA